MALTIRVFVQKYKHMMTHQYSINYIVSFSWLPVVLLLGWCLLPSQAWAEDETSKSMEERSLDAHGVMSSPDPKFITEGSSARIQGVYFGVGFRQVRLNFRNNISFVSNDATTNGVAFNLGHFTESRVLEYSRHVSILELGRTLEFEDQLFNFVEVIQNNFWYFFANRIANNFYVHYGLGLQAVEVRIILKADEDASTEDASELEDSSKLSREDSLLAGMGMAYFFTDNFFIQYRLAQGNYSPLLTGQKINNVLHGSQLHTLFLQYYFSL